MNNAGGEWPEKVFAQKAFLDFLDEPLASPRRRREGVYESYTYRGLGRRKDRSVRVVLLDTRYSMSRVKVWRKVGRSCTAVCVCVCSYVYACVHSCV